MENPSLIPRLSVSDTSLVKRTFDSQSIESTSSPTICALSASTIQPMTPSQTPEAITRPGRNGAMNFTSPLPARKKEKETKRFKTEEAKKVYKTLDIQDKKLQRKIEYEGGEGEVISQKRRKDFQDLIERADQFEGKMEGVKTSRGRLYEIQNQELEEFIQEQGRTIERLRELERQLDAQMKGMDYVVAGKDPIVPESEQVQMKVARLNVELKRTQDMWGELGVQIGRSKSLDLLKLVRMKHAIKRNL